MIKTLTFMPSEYTALRNVALIVEKHHAGALDRMRRDKDPAMSKLARDMETLVKRIKKETSNG